MLRKNKIIFLGADHRGFALKEELKKFLEKNNFKFKDLGALKFEEKDDAVDYAKKVAKSAIEHKAYGILICGTGAGMCIAANRFKGVNAVNIFDEKIAKLSREHNDSNVLCLGANFLSVAKAKNIILAWINTEFSKEARFLRRIKKTNNL